MKLTFLQILATLLLCSAVQAQNATAEQRLVLPSGLVAELQEVLLDGAIYRFRFVAPGFTGVGDAFELVHGDMEFLCTEYALPRLIESKVEPDQVIISLADQPLEFGVINPDVIQVFEAYSIKDGTCIWEAF